MLDVVCEPGVISEKEDGSSHVLRGGVLSRVKLDLEQASAEKMDAVLGLLANTEFVQRHKHIVGVPNGMTDPAYRLAEMAGKRAVRLNKSPLDDCFVFPGFRVDGQYRTDTLVLEGVTSTGGSVMRAIDCLRVGNNGVLYAVSLVKRGSDFDLKPERSLSLQGVLSIVSLDIDPSDSAERVHAQAMQLKKSL